MKNNAATESSKIKGNSRKKTEKNGKTSTNYRSKTKTEKSSTKVAQKVA